METISFKEKNRRDHSLIVCCGHTLVWYLSLIYPPPFHIVWVVGDFEDFPVLGWAHFILCQACDWQEISDTMMPLRPPPLLTSPPYILYRRPVRSQKLRMLSSINGFDRLHIYVHVWELRLREMTTSPGKRRVNCTGCTWLRNLIISFETLGWLLYVCCVFLLLLLLPSSLEYFFYKSLLHSQAKRSLKSEGGWRPRYMRIEQLFNAFHLTSC